MIEWWNSLSSVNQAFYVAAGFFSLIFLWQFIASLIGLSGGETDVEVGHVDAGDVDVGHVDGADFHSIEAHSAGEAGDTIAAFKFLSIRAILAFVTLFFWAGALYLDQERGLFIALVYAVAWGAGGWLVMTLVVNWMRRLAETGTARLSTAVGVKGSVYMNVPAGGAGKVRVPVSGVISIVDARSAGGEALPAGTAIQVLRLLDSSTVEVRPTGGDNSGKEGNP